MTRRSPSSAGKPDWLKVRLPAGEGYAAVARLLKEQGLNTVCSSARCPNRAACWGEKTATFMILGKVCSRGCRFCAVEAGAAALPDADEPRRVAEAVKTLGLRHVVITSVTRDDLGDGGAAHFAAAVAAIRAQSPACQVELLVPDFQGDAAALATAVCCRPDVFGHNVETVVRLYPQVRPGADLWRSLALLRQGAAAGLVTKSGFMVGLGESEAEIDELLEQLRETGLSILTVGQYLQPTADQLPVVRYYTPQEFRRLEEKGKRLGIPAVQAGPLVRSSYLAQETLAALRRASARD